MSRENCLSTFLNPIKYFVHQRKMSEPNEFEQERLGHILELTVDERKGTKGRLSIRVGVSVEGMRYTELDDFSNQLDRKGGKHFLEGERGEEWNISSTIDSDTGLIQRQLNRSRELQI
jgi:hypothetical protein